MINFLLTSGSSTLKYATRRNFFRLNVEVKLPSNFPAVRHDSLIIIMRLQVSRVRLFPPLKHELWWCVTSCAAFKVRNKNCSLSTSEAGSSVRGRQQQANVGQKAGYFQLLLFSKYTNNIKISLFWSLEDLQAAEAALESSEEDNGGESPPPHKKARRESSVSCSNLLSLSTSKATESSVMHDEIRVTQSAGEKERNSNGELACGSKQIANGGGDEETLTRDTSGVLKHKLSRFDEEVIRLIGQHLQNMGLQLVIILLCFELCIMSQAVKIKTTN